MTTLPQTLPAAPARSRSAPNSNGTHAGHGDQSVAGVPALASPPALSPAMYNRPGGAGPAPASGLTGADVMRVIRQNLWLFALAAVISGGIGYLVNRYLDENHRQFTAEGLVQVRLPQVFDPTNTVRVGAGARDSDLDLKTAMENQAQRMRSDELLTSLLTDPASVLSNDEWLRSKAAGANGQLNLGQALKVLKRNFSASPREGSSLIYVSMTAGDRGSSKAILDEVVNTYIDNVSEARQRDTGRNAQMLEQYAQQMRLDVQRLDREVRDLGASLVGGSDEQSGIVLQSTLMNLGTEKIKVEREAREARTMLESAERSMAMGTEPAGVEAELMRDPLLQNYRGEVDALEVNRETLARTRGTNHETFEDLDLRLDSWREKVRQREEMLRAQYRDQYLSSLRTAAGAMEKDLQEIADREAQLNEAFNAVSSTESDFRAKRDQLAEANKEMRKIEQQLATVRFDANSRQQEELQWADRPVTPASPSFPDLKMTLALSLLLGVGLAVGLAFLREVLDDSVRSPRDIARVGQMNVLGVVAEAGSDPEAGDPLELTIANAPHSMTAEQLRGVRSRLGHVAPLDTTRTILVTSPQPGDGKTTVACNLAAGLALGGRRVLLADANFRRPAVHSVFDLPCEGGLGEVLADPERFEELVKETSVPNLSVLVAGAKPERATELVEGRGFEDFVDAALEQFDHVVFDSGPILFVSETGALAPRCDGVVSVVRARKSSRGLLGRLRDSLRSLNTEHLGVVLNAVRHHAGGYYSRNLKTYYRYQRD